MPENEKPPAMRVDIYFVQKTTLKNINPEEPYSFKSHSPGLTFLCGMWTCIGVNNELHLETLYFSRLLGCFFEIDTTIYAACYVI
jgi:hypothetical protein